MSNQLANELHKPIIRKFKRHKVYSIFGQEVILLIHKQIKFLLCMIDLFSKHACVVFLNDEKGITNVNTFQSILNN